jgi:CSLREA domain-containing protein
MNDVRVATCTEARHRAGFALLTLVLSVLLQVTATTAGAATFAVTTTADSNDGACTVSLCSLRDAIIAANNNAGADVITLPAGTYTLAIAGSNEDFAATGDLDIRDDVAINGAGAATTIVDGGAIDRVFHVVTNSTVVMNGLTIRNGATTLSGGGISAAGVLTLSGVVVSGNHTSGQGGGIFASTLTLDNSVVTGNQTSNQGGGIFAGSLTMTDSTVAGNQSTGDQGGGIFLINGASSITGSTISANTGGDDGGGIYLNGSINVNAPATLAITNSTISDNSISSGNGGGLFILSQATVTIRDSTIASNSASGVANLENGGANVTLTNTIVANPVSGSNCGGTAVTDGGTNLQFPGTSCGVSIPSADPLLQALANNGGATQTRALGAGSPAIDSGTTGCPPAPATDQRGVARPQGPACDIGAFEGQAGVALPALSINNVTLGEGNGGSTPFVFTVTLSAPSATTVTVNFATANGTAVAGSDYVATSGVLTFAAGITTQTITVSVVGDTVVEGNETFFVNLSSPANATIAAAQGTGTIVDDDTAVVPAALVPIPTLGEWSLLLLTVLVAGVAAVRMRNRRVR